MLRSSKSGVFQMTRHQLLIPKEFVSTYHLRRPHRDEYQVANMKRVIISVLAMFTIVGCGNGSVDEADAEATIATNAPDVSFKPGASSDHTVKPQGPVTIVYKIIGAPIVGQPSAVDLQVKSTLGPQAITLSYRINDTTAMQFSEAQSLQVSIAPTNDEEPSLQQVRVIPMREGRLFLNVSATVETEGGTMSTVTAIPIEVGAAPREAQENGEVLTDENGELIRSLPAKED